MEKEYISKEKVGFYGAFYPSGKKQHVAMIYMMGLTCDNFLVSIGVKWLHQFNIDVLSLSPSENEQGLHDYPIENFQKAVDWLKERGYQKIGIVGGSATATMALIGASYCPDISMTVAITPSDFMMEGYYRDLKDGAKERPGHQQSIVNHQGHSLPYLPYAYRHPEYWQKLQEESHRTHNLIASREMFELSEKKTKLEDNMMIKVENIRGHLILVGSKDDCLWDTCRYIERMKKRLKDHHSLVHCQSYLYEHGTHFIFPQTMITSSLPMIGNLIVCMFAQGRKHFKECHYNRIDLDHHLRDDLTKWIQDIY